MISGLIGKKLGMTQIFNAAGKVVPITVLQVVHHALSHRSKQKTVMDMHQCN